MYGQQYAIIGKITLHKTIFDKHVYKFCGNLILNVFFISKDVTSDYHKLELHFYVR